MCKCNWMGIVGVVLGGSKGSEVTSTIGFVPEVSAVFPAVKIRRRDINKMHTVFAPVSSNGDQRPTTRTS